MSILKNTPLIVIMWILSLITSLGVAYVAPSIFPSTVSTDMIANNAVITTKLADGTVTSAKIVDGTITAIDLADGTIISATITNGAVTTDKIADDAITADKVSDEVWSAILTTTIENDTVTTDKIVDGAIVTLKLADDVITSAKIIDGEVMAVDLANGAIITTTIANGAVTTNKIADSAVTTEKLADSAVTATKLAPGAIPFASASATMPESTTSTSYVTMPDMSVTLTLTRTSHIIIMFSGEAWQNPGGPGGPALAIQAMVDSVTAYPGTNVIVTNDDGASISSYSYIFSLPDVSSGSHIISIEWKVFSGFTGNVQKRVLTVLALPA